MHTYKHTSLRASAVHNHSIALLLPLWLSRAPWGSGSALIGYHIAAAGDGPLLRHIFLEVRCNLTRRISEEEGAAGALVGGMSPGYPVTLLRGAASGATSKDLRRWCGVVWCALM